MSILKKTLLITSLLFSSLTWADELSVRLVGINKDGKEGKIFNLQQILLLNSNVKKTSSDYLTGSIIKFDVTNIPAGTKVRFLVQAYGWKVLSPHNAIFFRPENLDEVVTIRMITNNSKLIVGELESIFTNKSDQSQAQKSHYIQVYANLELKKVEKVQKLLISRGFKRVKYKTENTESSTDINDIKLMHKVVVGPYSSRKEADKKLKAINRYPFFKEQKPYIRQY